MVTSFQPSFSKTIWMLRSIKLLRFLVISIVSLAWNEFWGTDAFSSFHKLGIQSRRFPSRILAGQDYGLTTVEKRYERANNQKIKDSRKERSDLSCADAKRALVELIPRMTGKDDEYRAVESYVNVLEEKYVPAHTLDFLNFAMSGDWQLLFSTNLTGSPKRKLRIREMTQTVEVDGLGGKLINTARWEYAENEHAFDTSGSFSIKCGYKVNKGARIIVESIHHEMRPAKGSDIPSDVPLLVGLLHQAIPSEIFDPCEHAMDTTYLDTDLRILRVTGPNYEGVRNIFMRKGSFEINPTI